MNMEILLEPVAEQQNSSHEAELFIQFINRLEGWKTRVKNFHWAAKRKNIHVYLDEWLEVISDYQDALAEGYMGILGRMSPVCIHGLSPVSSDPWELIDEIRKDTCSFYNSIPENTVYVGIKSDCETFIQNINKYKYLFSLCHREEM